MTVLLSMVCFAGGACSDDPGSTRTGATAAVATTVVSDPACSWVGSAAARAAVGADIVAGPSDRSLIKPTATSQVWCPLASTDGTFLGGATVFTFASPTAARAVYDSDVTQFGGQKCSSGNAGEATEVAVDGADAAIIYQCGDTPYAFAGSRTFNIGYHTDITPTQEATVAFLASVIASASA